MVRHPRLEGHCVIWQIKAVSFDLTLPGIVGGAALADVAQHRCNASGRLRWFACHILLAGVCGIVWRDATAGHVHSQS